MDGIKKIHKQELVHKEPHPLLRQFVSHYIFRHIDFPENGYLAKSMPLRLVDSIDFFIGDPFDTVDSVSGKLLPFFRTTIRGPRTCKNCIIYVKGNFISFSIKFHPTALFNLIGIPMCHFRDTYINGGDIGLLPFDRMVEQLMYAESIEACIDVVEPYFMRRALDARTMISTVTSHIAKKLILGSGAGSIIGLAKEHYLSLRQMERNFIREIGVSPKSYACMHRFLNLIADKTCKLSQSWTELAHRHGYFDQMHLVKEFKNYLDILPSDFVPDDFAF